MAKELYITYTRKFTISKKVRVSNPMAKRLLGLDGEDLEALPDVTWEDGACDCDFTLIAESLTDQSDIEEGECCLEDLCVSICN